MSDRYIVLVRLLDALAYLNLVQAALTILRAYVCAREDGLTDRRRRHEGGLR